MKIIAENLTLRYPSSENYVFKNLSIEMDGPGFHALFGPSGIGKTTFAKIIAGIMGEYEGKIRIIHNEDYENEKKTLRLISHNDRILRGKEYVQVLYTHNQERLPAWSNIRKHLDEISLLCSAEKKEKLISIFGLNSLMSLRFNQLSLGQKNRVNLVRYLLQDFLILIMDESLANVDEGTRECILSNIKDLFPESFFLYISHNAIEVSKYCGKIYVFRGFHKNPRVMSVKGLNCRKGKDTAASDLNQTILEIMNAS